MSKQAVILLGGKGTRIQSLYADRPKCLVPVAGKPFLLWQMEWLQAAGFERVHLAAGYMADVLISWLETHPFADMYITLSVEEQPLGTGGALLYARDYLEDETFFVLNGDSLAPKLDFQALEKAHQKSSNVWNFPEKKFQRLELFPCGLFRVGCVCFGFVWG